MADPTTANYDSRVLRAMARLNTDALELGNMMRRPVRAVF